MLAFSGGLCSLSTSSYWFIALSACFTWTEISKFEYLNNFTHSNSANRIWFEYCFHVRIFDYNPTLYPMPRCQFVQSYGLRATGVTTNHNRNTNPNPNILPMDIFCHTHFGTCCNWLCLLHDVTAYTPVIVTGSVVRIWERAALHRSPIHFTGKNLSLFILLQ